MFTGDVKFKEYFLQEVSNNYDSIKTEATKYQLNIILNNSTLNLYEDVIYKKDIYNFTTAEIKNFLKALLITNEQTLATNTALLRKYLSFAIKKKVSVFNMIQLTPLSAEDKKEIIYELGEREKYFTKDMLRRTLNKKHPNGQFIIPYDQDKAMYIMIYNGILGKGAEDLARFKKEHFKYVDKILLFKDKRIELEDWEADILYDAMHETYREDKRVFEKHDSGFRYRDDEFLMKRINYKKPKEGITQTQALTDQSISSRIRRNNRMLNTPYWTPTNIYASGVVSRMLAIKENWTHVEVDEFLSESDIRLSHQRVKRGIEIMKEKVKEDI